MDIEKLLEEKIQKAEKGRKYWLSLKENTPLSDDAYIIMFPEIKTKCNYYVLKHLDKFAEEKNCNHFLFLSSDQDIIKQAEELVSTHYKMVLCSENDIDALICYYMMQMFTEHFIIASLEKPDGRNGKNIIGVNGITEEEVVAIGILGLKEI